jgi:hypothetical protein
VSDEKPDVINQDVFGGKPKAALSVKGRKMRVWCPQCDKWVVPVLSDHGFAIFGICPVLAHGALVEYKGASE